MLKLSEEEIAQEYKRYEDEIKLRDKQIEVLKSALNKESTPDHSQCKSTSDFEKLEEDLKESKMYAEEMKKSLIEKDLTISDLIDSTSLLKKENEENNSKYTEEVIRLNNKISEYTEEVNRLNNKISDLENKVKDTKELSEVLQTEKEDLINKLKEASDKKEDQDQLVSLTKEYESEKANSNLLRKEREDLESKLTNMKSTLAEIKDKFEAEVAKKEKLTLENNLLELTKKIKLLEDTIKVSKKTISGLNKDKLELEEIILKQEERVGELSTKFGIIDKLVKDKNKELKENEGHIMQLVNIIEDQKITISNFPREEDREDDSQRIVQLNNIIHNLKRECQVKDTKIITLQNRLNANSTDNNKNQFKGDKPTLPKNSQIKSNKISTKSKIGSNGGEISELPIINTHRKEEKAENDNKIEEITHMMNKLLEEN